jgi:hypothetical protein
MIAVTNAIITMKFKLNVRRIPPDAQICQEVTVVRIRMNRSEVCDQSPHAVYNGTCKIILVTLHLSQSLFLQKAAACP